MMAKVKAEGAAKYWEAEQSFCWCHGYWKKIGSQNSQYRQDIQCQKCREETKARLKSALGTNFLLRAWPSSLTMEAEQKRVTRDSRASVGAERRLNPHSPKKFLSAEVHKKLHQRPIHAGNKLFLKIGFNLLSWQNERLVFLKKWVENI